MHLPLLPLLMALGLPLLLLTPGARAAGAEDYALTIIIIEGRATVAPAGTDTWSPARTNQTLKVRDRIHTEALSRVVLRSTEGNVQEMDEETDLVIKDPRAGSDRPVLQFLRGRLRSFLRGGSADLDMNNQTAAATRGTEFVTSVDANDRVELTVFDGVVELTNPQGGVTLTNYEQGVALPGQVPTKSPVLDAVNVIQWSLYYPGVLDAEELPWTAGERNALAASLAAYQRGDLLAALAAYPAGRAPATEAERVYRAALLLVVGQVEKAQVLLNASAANSEPVLALRKLIATVKGETFAAPAAPATATGWLAESYYRQSRLDLDGALAAARAAAQISPRFGFALARVAELEFSFGRVDAAWTALDQSLAVAPRNAAALALKGFLLAARNNISAAIRQFDEALAVDGALPDAWLGRGLARIRQGDAAGGRADLGTAAALAPTRAVLRSYLAKAFSDAGDDGHATREIALARSLDEQDPTSWLYSALHHQRQNRINAAIRELERSQELNENRALYRSRLLLDQDAAVRSANLAGIYADAGLTDVSVREAGRAVSEDHGNYSAHLFLANSYERLRDPKQVNLRYETAALSEYLIANLLAPVGAGSLSPAISQQEYSKLFERDRLGLSSVTEYQSGGNWFENAAQYGTFGNTSFSIEQLYRTDGGQRPNNDLEQHQFSAQLKQQLTAHDTLFFSATEYRAKSGDVAQYYDPRQASRTARTREAHDPDVLAGYHREWAPGQHTLLLGARLEDTLRLQDPARPLLAVNRDGQGQINGAGFGRTSEDYRTDLEIYSGELQQIITLENHATVLGARYQAGEFATRAVQTNLVDAIPGVPFAYGDRRNITPEFQRATLYAYHSWTVAEPLQLVGGVAYDQLTLPRNFRFAPIEDGEETSARVSPKAGLIWTVNRDTKVRLNYVQGLNGVSVDQSTRIEPSQVAGFNQAFRSVIPESAGGTTAGERFESANFSLEHKFPTETYAAVAGEWLNSKEHHLAGAGRLGAFAFPDPVPVSRDHVRRRLDYGERSLTVSLNQLAGEEWAFGARYRLTHSDLSIINPDIPHGGVPSGNDVFPRAIDARSLLHQLTLDAIYNHPSGFFAQAQAIWTAQENGRDLEAAQPGDDFWQGNVFAGWRLWRRRAEISVGVLNVANGDYQLQPLTPYNELPRERTFVTRLQFKF